MRVVILIDNLAKEGLLEEWGLSIFIEHQDRRILLDAGSSGKFIENAKRLGIDLSKVDDVVLSHAHYDHADGLADFFAVNDKAKVYLRAGSEEDCYHHSSKDTHYIGIRQGLLKQFADRFVYVEGDYELSPKAYLIPHKTQGLEERGRQNAMYRKKGDTYVPDEFAHEQSLVLDTRAGWILFNSCSHGGADVILKEVERTFPDKQICAYIGGFHLFRTPPEQIRALAGQLKEGAVSHFYTGHCTGTEAYALLKEALGERIEQFYAGFVLEDKKLQIS